MNHLSHRRNPLYICLSAMVALALGSGSFAWAQSATSAAQQKNRDNDRRSSIELRLLRPDGRLRGFNFLAGVRGWGVRSDTTRRVLAHADEMELTDQQEQSIRQAQREQRREQIRRDADMEIAELDLEELFDHEAADLDTIEQLLRQLSNLQVEEQMANLRLDRSVRGLLTAEQLEKLDELPNIFTISVGDDRRRERRRR
ncbi:MAG: hypothetical protein ACE5HV_14295 [Acidobacteriota bacterium]